MVGGVPATTVDVRVDTRRVKDYAPFCRSACVLSFADEGVTWGFEAAKPARMHVLEHRDKTIIVTETAPSTESRHRNAALLQTLRFT